MLNNYENIGNWMLLRGNITIKNTAVNATTVWILCPKDFIVTDDDNQ